MREEKLKENKLGLIDHLQIMLIMGFEIIKSNSEQIALNTYKNDMPMVINNDIGYLTPLPYQWFDIKNEIERLKELQKV